jgi:3-oxoadipate enol-lactonase
VITVDLALRHSHLLRGVVLSEPPLFSLEPSIGEQAMGQIRSRVDPAVARGGPRAGADAFLSFICAEMWAIIDDDRKDRLRDNAEIAFADMEAPSLDVDAGDLSTIALPALVIAGTTSPAALQAIARPLAGALTDSRFVEIAGGHVPNIEHPEEFADVVSTFAAELDRRAPVRTT